MRAAIESNRGAAPSVRERHRPATRFEPGSIGLAWREAGTQLRQTLSGAVRAGRCVAAGGFSPAAYAAAGALDTTFKGSGQVTIVIGNTPSAAPGAFQPDGKVIG